MSLPSSRETTGLETLPRTPSPLLQARPSLHPTQQQEREWVRDQRVCHSNLRDKIRHLETILTTAATARGIWQQKVLQLRSHFEHFISVKAILKTIEEAGAQLDANEAQAAIKQIIQHRHIVEEIQKCTDAARERLSLLRQRVQELHEEREELCLHRERVLALRLHAMLSAPPVRYGDPFDKLVGAVASSTPTGPLYEVSHPDPPAPRSRCQFPTNSNRVLVQLRQARALAGLDTGLMDEEIAYRVLRTPIEWGRVGSIGIDWSFVLRQHLLPAMDPSNEDQSRPYWGFADVVESGNENMDGM
ncbi:FUSC domain containing protein [Pyrenophora tritici-repentis]|uniref:FUSC domain containing protein n=1 Tax=Pyrenophora tritici-repentis TaxID=45151 RepID=A0A317A216_9PLEO|nr:hypothetical protein A1F99_074250 [Pyrenophora tritici-repentis]KAF7571765.1 FUSC domain containing protein [Pyrenophora tritici-repentis]KAI1517320.1 hypothetical protein Ptr86124_004257 [Pyrenophora tritici-repentis]KAI1681736.1 hypothetical protein KJE20_08607 [Pyrenophora tritici-repentis]